MNNVSFTGINNVKIFTRQRSQIGSYPDVNGKIKQGEKLYTEIKLHCNLTNDKNGNDLDDFYDTISKSRPCYQFNCIKKENPNGFNLDLKRIDVKDNLMKITKSFFQINDYDIMFDERKILPLAGFIAKITKKLSKSPELSEEQQKIMKFANQSIAKEAEDFIENSASI